MLTTALSNAGRRVAAPSVLARRVAVAAQISGDELLDFENDSLFRSRHTRKTVQSNHQVSLGTKPKIDKKLRELQLTSLPRFGRSAIHEHSQHAYNPSPPLSAPPDDERLHALDYSSPRTGMALGNRRASFSRSGHPFVHDHHVYDHAPEFTAPPDIHWESSTPRFDQSAVVHENHAYGSTKYFSMQSMVQPKQCLEANETPPSLDQFAFEHEKHVYGSTKYFSSRKMRYQASRSTDGNPEPLPVWHNTELYETRSQKTTCKV